MSVSDNNMSGRSHDPEQIDLIDLLVQLWRGKVTIVIAIVIAIVLAVGYLAVAKEKWTSTAIITQPDVGQIATYNNALNVLYGVSAPKATELQTNVVGRFSTSLSALAETLDNQEEPRLLVNGRRRNACSFDDLFQFLFFYRTLGKLADRTAFAYQFFVFHIVYL